MPINVFGNSSHDNKNKIDTSLFVQKPFLSSNYIESNVEENIDMKNQYRITNLPDPLSVREACSKNYVDQKFRNDIDFNDVKLENIKFVKVNYQPDVNEHLTPKVYVDNAIHESSLVRNNKDNGFSGYNLTNINCITLNKQAENDNEVITKAYVDQFHQENERSRRDAGLSFYNEEIDFVKNNQDNDFNDKKLTNIDSITVNRNPNSDNELANKKYIDNELDKNTIVRFNQSLENYLKLSIGNDTNNLAKYDKINLTDITEMRNPNTGQSLLQKRVLKCLSKNYNAKINTFLKSTTSTSPTAESGANSIPPIGWSFMYVETSGNNHGANHKMVSWERTDIIHVSKIKFYYKRFSISDQNLRGMGRFKIQILLQDNSWSTIYNKNRNSQYSNGSTVWHLFDLNITQENYGIKSIYDQIPTPHSDMCFSNIILTHSV